eukprot:6085890-Pleurochrysis_carterae.AAC.1
MAPRSTSCAVFVEAAPARAVQGRAANHGVPVGCVRVAARRVHARPTCRLVVAGHRAQRLREEFLERGGGDHADGQVANVELALLAPHGRRAARRQTCAAKGSFKRTHGSSDESGLDRRRRQVRRCGGEAVRGRVACARAIGVGARARVERTRRPRGNHSVRSLSLKLEL